MRRCALTKPLVVSHINVAANVNWKFTILTIGPWLRNTQCKENGWCMPAVLALGRPARRHPSMEALWNHINGIATANVEWKSTILTIGHWLWNTSMYQTCTLQWARRGLYCNHRILMQNVAYGNVASGCKEELPQGYCSSVSNAEVSKASLNSYSAEVPLRHTTITWILSGKYTAATKLFQEQVRTCLKVWFLCGSRVILTLGLYANEQRYM